jgi:hypothetical protein
MNQCAVGGLLRGIQDLLERNRSRQHDKDRGASDSRLQAPFVVVQTDAEDYINVDATTKHDEVTLSLGRQCRIKTAADIFRAVGHAASVMVASSGSPGSSPAVMNELRLPAPDRLVDATATATATATAAAAAVTTPVGAPLLSLWL